MNRELIGKAVALLVSYRDYTEDCRIANVCGEIVEALKTELAKPDNQMEITVRRKTVYGNETIYPVCDTAKCLTMLGDTKTLTQRQIGIIKALGYKIVLEQQEEV